MRFILTACIMGMLLNCNTTTDSPNSFAASCLSLTDDGQEACEDPDAVATAACVWENNKCVESTTSNTGDSVCRDFSASLCPDYCVKTSSSCEDSPTVCVEYFSDTSCPNTCAWDFIRQACNEISGTKQYKLNALWNYYNTTTLRLVTTQPVDDSYLGRRVLVRILASRNANEDQKSKILADFAPFVGHIAAIDEVENTRGQMDGVITLTELAPTLGTTYAPVYVEGSVTIIF